MLEELIHRSSLVGFDGHSQVRPGCRFFAETFPAFRRVFELEVGDDFSLHVHNDYSMVIARPIQAGIVGDVFPFFHLSSFVRWHRGAVMRRPDTRSLAGCRSLRRLDGRRRTDR